MLFAIFAARWVGINAADNGLNRAAAAHVRDFRKMSDIHDGLEKRYSYGPYHKMANYFLTLMLIVMVGAVILTFRVGPIWAAAGLSLFVILMFAVNLSLFLCVVSISVSDAGISCYKFGRKLRFVRWQDVEKIKKTRYWAFGEYRYKADYNIFVGDYGISRFFFGNLRGPIGILDDIRDLRGFLDQVNGYARQYGFPLIVEDQEVAHKQAAQSGAGGPLRRILPPTEEVRVSEF